MKSKSSIKSHDNNLKFQPVSWERAAVPVNWNEATKELLEMDDLADAPANAVLRATYALSWESYRNYTSVEGWSRAAKEWQAPLNSENSMFHTTSISNRPLLWSDLPPENAFIAVNQKLDINDLEGDAIIKSKKAWPE